MLRIYEQKEKEPELLVICWSHHSSPSMPTNRFYLHEREIFSCFIKSLLLGFSVIHS